VDGGKSPSLSWRRRRMNKQRRMTRRRMISRRAAPRTPIIMVLVFVREALDLRMESSAAREAVGTAVMIGPCVEKVVCKVVETVM
jgi:hypothetical protein